MSACPATLGRVSNADPYADIDWDRADLTPPADAWAPPADESWAPPEDGWMPPPDDAFDGRFSGPAARVPSSAAAEGIWRVEQTIDDPAGDHDWRIRAEVDLAASVEEGAAVVRVTEVLRL